MFQAKVSRRIGMMCVVSSFFAPEVIAQDKLKWSGEASVGTTADSNVGIPELDKSTGEGDIGFLAGAKLGVDYKPVDKLTIKTGYEFSGTFYDEYNDFNLKTHNANISAEYDFGAFKSGGSYTYVVAELGDEKYLDYKLASLFGSTFIGKKVFLRGAYERVNKEYDTQINRDADGNAVRIDVYYFLDGSKRYVSAGVKLSDEDAVSDAFDFESVDAKLRFTQRMKLLERDVKLRAGTSWEKKDYSGITPAINAQRDDEIVSITGDLEMALKGPFAIDFGYEYKDRSSNLASANYDEHVAKLRLKASF